MIRNTVQVLPFDRAALVAELDESRAVDYLFVYLSNAAMGARSFVVESHYVDRHFLDDYAAYYSRSFNAPLPYCGRLHFFTLEQREIERVFKGAYADPAALERARRKLQSAYCGFVVKRPLGGATMGRTVLKTYPVDDRRHYTAVRPYAVNLAGLRLTVEGLAYQQQDGGAAVCASTALWSALQKVARIAGHRTPTPSSITAAARSPYPASYGLGDFESATALATLGYAAELFPAHNTALFRMKVVTCLRSELPVVLTLKLDSQIHAVTITGYSEPGEIVEVSSEKATFRTRFGSVETIYVHDDNLGSHAHYELFVDEAEPDTMKLRRGSSGPTRPGWLKPQNWDEVWEVDSAMVPKPKKLRVEVDGIIQNLLWLQEEFEQIVFEGLSIHYETRFESGVGYRAALVAEEVDRTKLRAFMSALALPRYVGVISLHHEQRRLCDVLIDVSEHDRQSGAPAVLGIVAPGVPARSLAHVNLDALCAMYDWLLITGPASAPAKKVRTKTRPTKGPQDRTNRPPTHGARRARQ